MTHSNGCEHKFSYLLKKYEDGNLIGRVLEIPAVMAEGRTKAKVESEIRKGTVTYLRQFEDEHRKASDGKMESSLVTTANGVIQEIVPYTVRC